MLHRDEIKQCVGEQYQAVFADGVCRAPSDIILGDSCFSFVLNSLGFARSSDEKCAKSGQIKILECETKKMSDSLCRTTASFDLQLSQSKPTVCAGPLLCTLATISITKQTPFSFGLLLEVVVGCRPNLLKP